MKKKASKKIAEAMMPYLPGYAYGSKPNAMFRVPVGDVFRGLIFDGSGFSSGTFYPHVFVLPLYVPSDRLTLSFGKRLPGTWEYREGHEEFLAKQLVQKLEKDGASRFLDELDDPEKLAANLGRHHPNPRDPYLLQAIGYSSAICRQFDDAGETLDRCVVSLQQMQQENPQIVWYSSLLREVSEFRDLLISDPKSALRQLDEWAEYTRSQVGVPA